MRSLSSITSSLPGTSHHFIYPCSGASFTHCKLMNMALYWNFRKCSKVEDKKKKMVAHATHFLYATLPPCHLVARPSSIALPSTVDEGRKLSDCPFLTDAEKVSHFSVVSRSSGNVFRRGWRVHSRPYFDSHEAELFSGWG